ncbi:hypothetical protein PS623_04700 [Pseudomonas fluorescens]|uniref:hypothetical protein n=1 Tax=Pseudomonas fluorescens TaxID=294 RepID=UPI0012403290|nr:hypothetical protein [Pseudomonas fluorescens]VVN29289.1 hypothetical protein PS623_04700 [Pseudomonas fluorescens]
MNQSIVAVLTAGGSVLFCTDLEGPALQLTEREDEAFSLTEGRAEAVVKKRNREYETIGLRFIAVEPAHSYKTCIVRNAGAQGYFLAPDGLIRAVPSELARVTGSRQTTLGSIALLQDLIAAGQFPWLESFTEAGLELMAGLACDIHTRGVYRAH